MSEGGQRWLDVGDVASVAKRRKFVVADGDATIVVVAHEGRVYALDNICIHRQRELVKGVVLRDRLVCPGHQWAFELGTGWEAVKQECQPTYEVRVTDAGRVEVDLASRRIAVSPPSPSSTSNSDPGADRPSDETARAQMRE